VDGYSSRELSKELIRVSSCRQSGVKKSFLGLFFILLLTSYGLGQRTKITGTVFDPSGAVIVGVTVTATSDARDQWQVRSDGFGKFDLELPPGDYRLEFYSVGFYLRILNCFTVDTALAQKPLVITLAPDDDESEPCGVAGNCGYTEEIESENMPFLGSITPRPVLEPKRSCDQE